MKHNKLKLRNNKYKINSYINKYMLIKIKWNLLIHNYNNKIDSKKIKDQKANSEPKEKFLKKLIIFNESQFNLIEKSFYLIVNNLKKLCL